MTKEGLTHVVMNMRRSDRDSIFPFRLNKDATQFIEDRWETGGACWECVKGDTYIAVGGCCVTSPVCITIWFIATDLWKSSMIEITRFIKRRLLPAVFEDGFRRVQACVLADDLRALNYALCLGFKEECIMTLGSGGERYYQMSMEVT